MTYRILLMCFSFNQLLIYICCVAVNQTIWTWLLQNANVCSDDLKVKRANPAHCAVRAAPQDVFCSYFLFSGIYGCYNYGSERILQPGPSSSPRPVSRLGFLPVCNKR